MTVLTPTASIWSVATRITALDSEGYPDPGNAMYVTEQKLKLDANQTQETGDEIKLKNATGNLAVYAKHGEIPIWGKVNLELAIPDPAIEALLTGGSPGPVSDTTMRSTLPITSARMVAGSAR